MKKLFIPILALTILSSCNKSTKMNQDQASNKKFDSYKEGFVTSLWQLNPDWAASQGYHKLDSILVVPNAEQQKKELDFVKAQLDSLHQFEIGALSDNNKTDFRMIKNQLESTLFSINELKSGEWNPSEYNVCGSFSEILNGKYDTEEVRLRAFGTKLSAVPAYYEAAKKNIKNPTIEHTDLAIAQNLGGSAVFEGE
jgi:hypothetical protein